MDLTAVCPVPRMMRLGGSDWAISRLRVRDLALVQRWLMDRAPCPFESSLASAEGLGGPAGRRRLADLYERCESWPPEPGTAAGEALLGTAEGVHFLLALALARHHADLKPVEVFDLAGRVTVAEWHPLRFFLFGGDPLLALSRLIDPEGAARGRGPEDAGPKNWAAEFCALSAETGLSFADLGELELPQYFALLNGGARDVGTLAMAPGANLAAEALRRRRLFHGDDDDAAEAAHGDG